jgi:hypothetical protein
MNRPSQTPGICRIDQPSHRTHGFFMRVHHRGKIHSAFFPDKKYNGREAALAAAQKGLLGLRRKLGLPRNYSRRWNAEVVRRKGRSGIPGVRRVDRKNSKGHRVNCWEAHWSPLPGVYRKKRFSVRKYGARKAKKLAMRARRTGVRNMK